MNAQEAESRRERLEMLLPFYLNGTLSDSERGEVEAWLTSDPAAAIALEEVEAEHSATVRANEAISPPADALPRFAAALAREAGAERAGRPFWLRRAGAWLAALPPAIPWTVAALAATLLAVQTARVGLQPHELPPVIGLEEVPLDAPPFVLVSFSEEASVREINDTLLELGLQISSGPLPGGLYRVPIPVETGAEYDRISASLQESSPVVWLVAGSRPAND